MSRPDPNEPFDRITDQALFEAECLPADDAAALPAVAGLADGAICAPMETCK